MIDGGALIRRDRVLHLDRGREGAHGLIEVGEDLDELGGDSRRRGSGRGVGPLRAAPAPAAHLLLLMLLLLLLIDVGKLLPRGGDPLPSLLLAVPAEILEHEVYLRQQPERRRDESKVRRVVVVVVVVVAAAVTVRRLSTRRGELPSRKGPWRSKHAASRSWRTRPRARRAFSLTPR